MNITKMKVNENRQEVSEYDNAEAENEDEY